MDRYALRTYTDEDIMDIVQKALDLAEVCDQFQATTTTPIAELAIIPGELDRRYHQLNALRRNLSSPIKWPKCELPAGFTRRRRGTKKLRHVDPLRTQ